MMESIEKVAAEIKMPKYKCHKTVHALKIESVLHGNPPDETDSVSLSFDDKRFADIEVPRKYVDKHHPVAGGYLVVYADGYQSFSPAEAFEAGYAKIDTSGNTTAAPEYINITLQDGPIQEVGVNGCQIDDVIMWCLDIVEGFNTKNGGKYACIENEECIESLRNAAQSLLTRTQKRAARGVEGTSKV